MTGQTNICISPWTSDARLAKPIRIMPDNRDEFDMAPPEMAHWAAVSSNYKSSLIKDPSLLPKYLCGSKLDTNLPQLPDVFHGAGMYIVSEKAACVFRRFDLGHGGRAPVTIFQGNRQAEVTDKQYNIVYFGCRKQAFSPELSNMAGFSRKMYIRPAQAGYNPLDISDGDCVLTATALEGPDVWIDTSVGIAFFMSGRLVAAISDANLSAMMPLKSCRIAGPA
jgi:hypothetical protein